MGNIILALLGSLGFVLVFGIICYEAGCAAKAREDAEQKSFGNTIGGVPLEDSFDDLEIPAILRREPVPQS